MSVYQFLVHLHRAWERGNAQTFLDAHEGKALREALAEAEQSRGTDEPGCNSDAPATRASEARPNHGLDIAADELRAALKLLETQAFMECTAAEQTEAHVRMALAIIEPALPLPAPHAVQGQEPTP